MNDSATTFWKARSENYEQLQWVKDDGFMERFLEAADLHPEDIVLDVGTGVGKVAHAANPHVEKVIGIDISPDMIGQAGNGDFLQQDVRDLQFEDNTFDKVLARMVLHHVTEGIDKALAECYRVLRPGGLMIVGEGTPPMAESPQEHLQHEITDFYSNVFSLKEDRLTLYEYDIVDLMVVAGFRAIDIDLYFIDRLSVRNWLSNSGLKENVQKRIFKMYEVPPNSVERAYHIEREYKPGEEDTFIRCRHAIVTGKKPGEIPSRDGARRLEQLRQHIAELFSRPGKVLYIGASHRVDCLAELKEAGHEITVLEIWPDNVWFLTADGRIDHLVQGDVRDIKALRLPHRYYDVAFWWHGPEHLPKSDVPWILEDLEDIANLIVVGCPNGWYEIGPQYGNPHEEHLSAWYVEDFEELGYEALPLDAKVDEAASNLTAWRKYG